MERQKAIFKLIYRLKFYIFIMLAMSFAPEIWAHCGVKHHHRVCTVTCYTKHKPHYKRHHTTHYCTPYKAPRHRYWRTTNYTTVDVYYPSCVCNQPRRSSCCGDYNANYDVYYSTPNYGSDWNYPRGVVNYDPPNENPYRHDINGDYNLTY